MSLRARLLIGMAFVAIVLVVSGLAITRTTKAHLIDQVDAQLQDARLPPRGFPRNQDRLSTLYVGFVSGDGTVQVVAEPNVMNEAPPPPQFTPEQVVDSAESGSPFTARSDDADVRYRVLGRPGQSGAVKGVVVFALPLNDVDDAVSRLIGLEIFVTLAVLGVMALVTWWVIRLGVRPVKRMTATATAIAAGDLSQRVPDDVPGTEAAELGDALNRMLGHIEAAFDQRTRSEERLRQFVADASHELRTPVATIRGYAELYHRGGLDAGEDLDGAMRRTEQEAVRMGRLIDDLLHLARLDQGRPLERRSVDLGAIVDDAVRDARAVDPDRAITAAIDHGVTVLGDDARLRQVVGNLIGNAFVHTPTGTPVHVRVGRPENGRAVIEVRDEGPGMSEDIAAHAFERFYRADPSRSRHRGGSGLGLAIVQATVAAHGGQVILDTAPGKGTTVHVELPALTRDGTPPEPPGPA